VPGSVRLTKNMEAERFSHVIHIVSEVEGVRRRNARIWMCSGRPFPRDRQRRPEIQGHGDRLRAGAVDRSFYAGAVGYLDAAGGFDTCIAIRSALVKDGRWYLQAGAGIVYASTPEREWEETNEKLAALRAALGGTKAAAAAGTGGEK
jgi:anthranilate synthase component 1